MLGVYYLTGANSLNPLKRKAGAVTCLLKMGEQRLRKHTTHHFWAADCVQACRANQERLQSGLRRRGRGAEPVQCLLCGFTRVIIIVFLSGKR